MTTHPSHSGTKSRQNNAFDLYMRTGEGLAVVDWLTHPELKSMPVLANSGQPSVPSDVPSTEWKSIYRTAFDHYLRTGRLVTMGEGLAGYERKFNPYHDERGRFTFAPGGAGQGASSQADLTPSKTSGSNAPAAGSAPAENSIPLTNEAENALLNSPLNDAQASALEAAVVKANEQYGVDPNVLLGMALQESGLGANMNASGAAKGLFGIESSDLDFINSHFNTNITTSDLTSLAPNSIDKVTMGVAQYLQHYSNIYSNYTDPSGLEVAISAWRVGIGRTRQNIRNGNFWDYIDPNLGESVQHYIDAVERLR